MLDPYLLIGEILKPQGIRGEIKVRPVTYDPGRFESLETVYLREGDAYRPVACSVTRLDAGAAYMRLQGIDNRDQAEALRGRGVFVDRAHAVELPEDTEFIVDLIGCEAVDDEGIAVGRLVDVLQPGATDVYVFQGSRGRMMAPALKTVILQVDVRNKTMLLSARGLRETAVWEDE